jgi:hypothetical protein
MTVCEMCGEEIDSLTCPFCKTVQEGQPTARRRKKKNLKVVNIKDDLPLVETALKRLDQQMSLARNEGYKALKVIHGYGASGKGGVIKDEIHRVLHRLYVNDDIENWIPGEDFSGDYQDTLEILKTNQFLESDEDFRSANRGISLIIF